MWKTFKVEQLTLRVTEVEGKVIPVHAMKPYRGSRGTAPVILNHGARWRLVVNIMPRPLYPWKNNPVPTE